MIKILFNPWTWVVVGALLIFTHWQAVEFGVDLQKGRQATAKEKAQDQAGNEVDKREQEARIVYKYIRDQDNTCDIYSDVIKRLHDPSRR